MRHAPSRFVLITIIIALVSYLVYFLGALAFGLASSYTEAIDEWEADSLILTTSANRNALASMIPADEASEIAREVGEDAAVLRLAPGVISDDEGRENVFIMAAQGFLAPELADGRLPEATGEIAVDPQAGEYAVGDTLTIPGSELDWTVTGITTGARFQASPTLFVAESAFEDAGGQPSPQAVVLRGEHSPQLSSGLEQVTVDEFVDNLPGYRAQILTFSLMIGSLILIVSLMLGIFIYVLTLQKSAVFGIMKARGIPTSYIARSGAAQILLLTAAGVLLGLAATLATSLVLPEAVPFAINTKIYAGVTVAFFVFTLVGSLIPLRTVTRIDPVEAIE